MSKSITLHVRYFAWSKYFEEYPLCLWVEYCFVWVYKVKTPVAHIQAISSLLAVSSVKTVGKQTAGDFSGIAKQKTSFWLTKLSRSRIMYVKEENISFVSGFLLIPDDFPPMYSVSRRSYKIHRNIIRTRDTDFDCNSLNVRFRFQYHLARTRQLFRSSPGSYVRRSSIHSLHFLGLCQQPRRCNICVNISARLSRLFRVTTWSSSTVRRSARNCEPVRVRIFRVYLRDTRWIVMSYEIIAIRAAIERPSFPSKFTKWRIRVSRLRFNMLTGVFK